MPNLRGKNPGSQSSAEPGDADVLFKLQLAEALGDEQVATKLAQIIRSTNQDLLDAFNALRTEVKSLKQALSDRDAAIANLTHEVIELRQANDALEQYGRRNNLRINGIEEPKLGDDEEEDTTAAVVRLANDELKLDPPLQASDIEVSHRLKKHAKAKKEEPRSIIVRFRSKYERYRVISSRKHLKDSNEEKTVKVYINEDLTQARARLFTIVRKLQKQKHFDQVWTYNGNIKVKDLRGTVRPISSLSDIKDCLPNVSIPT